MAYLIYDRSGCRNLVGTNALKACFLYNFLDRKVSLVLTVIVAKTHCDECLSLLCGHFVKARLKALRERDKPRQGVVANTVFTKFNTKNPQGVEPCGSLFAPLGFGDSTRDCRSSRYASSASSARRLITAKNASDWPLNSPSSV